MIIFCFLYNLFTRYLLKFGWPRIDLFVLMEISVSWWTLDLTKNLLISIRSSYRLPGVPVRMLIYSTVYFCALFLHVW